MTAWPCPCGGVADLNGAHIDGVPVCNPCLEAGVYSVLPIAQRLLFTPRLTIELVPVGTWGSNLRSLLTKSQWDKLRHYAYAQAGGVCEICGDKGTNQGRKHDLEAHEIWEYDDVSHTQKLLGVIALCPRCHQVKHMGRTCKYGGGYKARAHIAKVNGWTAQGVAAYEGLSYLVHNLRSQYRWSVDIQDGLMRYTGEGMPLTVEQVKKAVKKAKERPRQQ